MSHKKKIGALLGISILTFCFGFVLTDPETYGVCSSDDFFECTEPLITQFGQPLFMGSIALALIFLILLFLPQRYFQAWLKYAAWFIPVGILLVISSDVNCSGGIGLGLCFDKELATWWSSGIYILLSLGVFLTTYIVQSRRK